MPNAPHSEKTLARLALAQASLKDGRVLKGRRDTTRGYPGAKASWSDAMEKYESCASLVMTPEQTAKSASLIRRITTLNSIRELTRELRVGKDK